jgi:alpha-1,3-rhamnosyl/mannosyltransferase
MTVAPLAVDNAWLSPSLGETAAPMERPYLLCVCTNKPHKNLPALVDAYGLLRAQLGAAPDLVIAGGWDARYPEAKAAAAPLAGDATHGAVRFLHDIDDARLRELYAHALGFVYPSRYEGFGLTPLEAMAWGLPLAVSTTPAVAEVVGDAAITFPPDDVAAMAAAMERLVSDAPLRRHLSDAARARARCFSWQATAEATLRAYDCALATR